MISRLRLSSRLMNGKVKRLLSKPLLNFTSRHFSITTETVKSLPNLMEVVKLSISEYKDNNYLGTWNGTNFDYITYGEFGEQIDKFRGVLSKLNVGVDDKVAIISNNRVEWAIAYFACNGLGAQAVPLYEAQTEADWNHIIEDSGASVLIVANDTVYDKTHHMVDKFDRLQHIINFDGSPDKENSYQKQMAEVTTSEIPAVFQPSKDHLTAIMYSSGTTGPPKGVEISHGNIMTNLHGFRETWVEELGEEFAATSSTKQSMCYLPWSHIFGLCCSLHASLLAGASVALVPNREAILSCADLIQPNEMSSVPLMLNKIYSGVLAKVADGSPRRQKIVAKAFEVARRRNSLVEKGQSIPLLLAIKFKLASVIMSKIRGKILGGKIEIFSAGGGKTSLEVLEFFEDVGLPVCEGYGMTEAAPVITLSTSPSFTRRKLGTVGKPLPGCHIQIRHPDTGVELPVDTEGEIFVAGDNVARGYHNLPKATEETFILDPISGKRYLRTGDLGSLDSENYLRISGRIKEQYKLQNGKFVSPGPIEDIICRSAFIMQAAVFGADREYNVVLLVPELAELGKWAEAHKVQGFPSTGVFSSDDERNTFLHSEAVLSLIQGDLQKYSSDIKGYEKVKKAVFLTDPFTADNNLLTQKMSLKRHNIAKVHEQTIEDVYAGESGFDVQM